MPCYEERKQKKKKKKKMKKKKDEQIEIFKFGFLDTVKGFSIAILMLFSIRIAMGSSS